MALDELFDSEEQKAKAFNIISDVYYKRNFGSIKKEDLDLLMFSIYYDRIIDSDLVDQYSDFIISKELGIKESKIKTLKEKKQLKYPNSNFKWKDEFYKSFTNMKILENNKVLLPVKDKCVENEIKEFMFSNGFIVENSLTSKSLVFDAEELMELLKYILKDKYSENEIIEIVDSQFQEYYDKQCVDKDTKMLHNFAGLAKETVFAIFQDIATKGL